MQAGLREVHRLRVGILAHLEGLHAVEEGPGGIPVSYTHLRAHETVLDLVCRLLLEKKTQQESHPSFGQSCIV